MRPMHDVLNYLHAQWTTLQYSTMCATQDSLCSCFSGTCGAVLPFATTRELSCSRLRRQVRRCAGLVC